MSWRGRRILPSCLGLCADMKGVHAADKVYHRCSVSVQEGRGDAMQGLTDWALKQSVRP